MKTNIGDTTGELLDEEKMEKQQKPKQRSTDKTKKKSAKQVSRSTSRTKKEKNIVLYNSSNDAIVVEDLKKESAKQEAPTLEGKIEQTPPTISVDEASAEQKAEIIPSNASSEIATGTDTKDKPKEKKSKRSKLSSSKSKSEPNLRGKRKKPKSQDGVKISDSERVLMVVKSNTVARDVNNLQHDSSTGEKKVAFAPKGEENKNRTTINDVVNVSTVKFVKKKKSKSKVHIKSEEGHFATVKSSKKKKLETLVAAPVEEDTIGTGEDITEQKDDVVENKKSKKRTKHHHHHHYSKKGTDEAIKDDTKSKKHTKKKSKEKKKMTKTIDDDNNKSDHLRSSSDELVTVPEHITPKTSALLVNVDDGEKTVASFPVTNEIGITEVMTEKTTALLSEEAPIVESGMILETLGTFVSTKSIVAVEEANESLPSETVELLEGIKTTMTVTTIEDTAISEAMEKTETTGKVEMLVDTTDECNTNETSKESRFIGKVEHENLVENDFSQREDECEAGEKKDKATIRVVNNNIEEDKTETEKDSVSETMFPNEESVRTNPIESSTDIVKPIICNLLRDSTLKAVDDRPTESTTVEGECTIEDVEDGKDFTTRSCEDQLDALAKTEVAPVETGVSKVSTSDETSPINEEESKLEGIPVEDEFNYVDREESDEDDAKNDTIDGEAKVDNIKKLTPPSDDEGMQDSPIEKSQNEELKPESTLVRDKFIDVEQEESDEEDAMDGNLLANERADTVIEIALDVEDTKLVYIPIRNELNDTEQDKFDEEDATNEHSPADESNDAKEEESNEMDTKNKNPISDEEEEGKEDTIKETSHDVVESKIISTPAVDTSNDAEQNESDDAKNQGLPDDGKGRGKDSNIRETDHDVVSKLTSITVVDESNDVEQDESEDAKNQNPPDDEKEREKDANIRETAHDVEVSKLTSTPVADESNYADLDKSVDASNQNPIDYEDEIEEDEKKTTITDRDHHEEESEPESALAGESNLTSITVKNESNNLVPEISRNNTVDVAEHISTNNNSPADDEEKDFYSIAIAKDEQSPKYEEESEVESSSVENGSNCDEQEDNSKKIVAENEEEIESTFIEGNPPDEEEKEHISMETTNLDLVPRKNEGCKVTNETKDNKKAVRDCGSNTDDKNREGNDTLQNTHEVEGIRSISRELEYMVKEFNLLSKENFELHKRVTKLEENQKKILQDHSIKCEKLKDTAKTALAALKEEQFSKSISAGAVIKLEKVILEKYRCMTKLQKELEFYKEEEIQKLNQLSESFEEVAYSTIDIEDVKE